MSASALMQLCSAEADPPQLFSTLHSLVGAPHFSAIRLILRSARATLLLGSASRQFAPVGVRSSVNWQACDSFCCVMAYFCTALPIWFWHFAASPAGDPGFP